jgi:type VI secretion system protein ImpC
MSDQDKSPFGFSFNIDSRNLKSEETRNGGPGEDVFNVALLGDFSGRDSRGLIDADGIGDRRFIEIDRYNLDEVISGLDVRLRLEFDEDTLDIAFGAFDDFKPDNLYNRVDAFGRLRELRARLQDNATFAQAAQEIQGWLMSEAEAAEPPPENDQFDEIDDVGLAQKQVTPASSDDSVSLLDSILDETARQDLQPAQPIPTPTLVDDFVKQMVMKRSGTVAADPRKQDMIAAVDAVISGLMRDILHHPKFQALEAGWQALRFLVKRVRTGKSIKLYLLDLSRRELEIDLSNDDVTKSQLYGLFCDASIGDDDWSLIIGNYRFGADIDDILLLSQIGYIAHQAHARFFAGADEKLVGCESFATTPNANRWQAEIDLSVSEAWSMLRQSPVAGSLSLALPRFLLRPPYGAGSQRIKSFAFEEMPDGPVHEHYLWGNAAFLKAEQLARTFSDQGRDMRPGEAALTEDLPLHHYQERGETVLKPCAEIPLTETGARMMIEQGLIPLWSVKNADRIHSDDFHSIALT